MKKFKVTVTETFEKIVEVEASCRNEAESIAMINYYDSEHVVDLKNFAGVKFTTPKEMQHER
ncbi:MAG: DpnD/PcfM family protein [Oscillospiraceae bacterium]|nr:DpnD/PcfM family protein [Oscillospiraceae bacterium]